MADDFEDHCWKDIVPADVLDIYSHYVRKTFVGPAPALLAIDLYELAYRGGAKPVAELHKTYASSCGEHAHAAIEPTKRLFAAARAAAAGQPARARHRNAAAERGARSRALCHQARVQAAGGRRRHHQAACQRLLRHAADGPSHPAWYQNHHRLRREHVGRVRASAVDAYSNGFHVVLAEECCFDRSMLSHKVNLFDLHHKYADVMHVDEVVSHLAGLSVRKAS
jgi:maleamate amidohydrolase